jgi:hypothetical protein
MSAMRAGLAWRRRTTMAIRYAERFAPDGTIEVVAAGYEATGADGTLYRIMGLPYGKSRKLWELYVLDPGSDRYRRVDLAFSGTLYVVQDLAGKLEGAS